MMRNTQRCSCSAAISTGAVAILLVSGNPALGQVRPTARVTPSQSIDIGPSKVVHVFLVPGTDPTKLAPNVLPTTSNRSGLDDWRVQTDAQGFWLRRDDPSSGTGPAMLEFLQRSGLISPTDRVQVHLFAKGADSKVWNGEDSIETRGLAASELSSQLDRIPRDELVILDGHSHGTTVLFDAANQSTRGADIAVAFSSPGLISPDPGKVRQTFSIYDRNDSVMMHAGDSGHFEGPTGSPGGSAVQNSTRIELPDRSGFTTPDPIGSHSTPISPQVLLGDVTAAMSNEVSALRTEAALNAVAGHSGSTQSVVTSDDSVRWAKSLGDGTSSITMGGDSTRPSARSSSPSSNDQNSSSRSQSGQLQLPGHSPLALQRTSQENSRPSDGLPSGEPQPLNASSGGFTSSSSGSISDTLAQVAASAAKSDPGSERGSNLVRSPDYRQDGATTNPFGPDNPLMKQLASIGPDPQFMKDLSAIMQHAQKQDLPDRTVKPSEPPAVPSHPTPADVAPLPKDSRVRPGRAKEDEHIIGLDKTSLEEYRRYEAALGTPMEAAATARYEKLQALGVLAASARNALPKNMIVEHAQYHPHATKDCDLIKGLKPGDEFDAQGHNEEIISESRACPICNPH